MTLNGIAINDVPMNDARTVRGYQRAGCLTRYLEDLK
jgi:hypothetical protein